MQEGLWEGFDGRTFGIYAGIAFAVFGLIGVAAGTIGFTAFLLAVPLLFVGFKFEPQEAIFISCCVDCCNACLILALSYWKREETSLPLLPRFSAHVRAVLIVGGIAVLCCCVCLVFAARILDVIKGRLKGGIGYVLLVIGALFILKGVLAYRKQRKLAQESEKVVVVTEEAPLLAVNQDIVEEVNPSVVSVTDVFCCRSRKEEASSCWRKAWRVLRPIVVIVVCLISGCMAGFVGVGAGLNFVLVFLICFELSIREATVAGCVMMAVLTALVLVSFSLPFGFKDVRFIFLWPFLLISLAFSLIGVLVGFFLSKRLSAIALNFLVGIVLILGGALATAEIIAFS